MNREELEYHLDTDMENYSTRYKANLDSRWNTPEFAALAADAVRKLQVLQSTKAFWEKHSHNFKQDMRKTLIFEYHPPQNPMKYLFELKLIIK